MTTSCKICEDTYYLAGDEALGPCVCVVPAALEARDEQIGELEDKLEELREEASSMADAKAALQDYMVSIGLPAEPIVLDNEHLTTLWGLFA